MRGKFGFCLALMSISTLAGAGAWAAEIPAFGANARILFQGDSITDGNRGRSADPNHILGHGYCFIIAAKYGAQFPERKLDFMNRGVSGNTVSNLQARWQKDTLELKPDILSILIGVNDVWRQFATEDELPYAVPLDEYETTYRQLLTTVTQKCNSRLVICEPFMFCDDFNNPMFAHLRTFIEVVHRIADDFGACMVPLQKAIDERIKQVPPQDWSLDMVHPEVWAHAWIAQQWLIAASL